MSDILMNAGQLWLLVLGSLAVLLAGPVNLVCVYRMTYVSHDELDVVVPCGLLMTFVGIPAMLWFWGVYLA